MVPARESGSQHSHGQARRCSRSQSVIELPSATARVAAETRRSDYSGAAGRPLTGPDAVRYMSVHNWNAGLSWTQRDLMRRKATAREPGYAQATGRFRRRWQVLGSNNVG
jgi:hypothetical protein